MKFSITVHRLHYEIEARPLVVLDFPLDKTQRAGALASPGARAPIAEIRKVVARELPGRDIQP